jgi:hypothetical protein
MIRHGTLLAILHRVGFSKLVSYNVKEECPQDEHAPLRVSRGPCELGCLSLGALVSSRSIKPLHAKDDTPVFINKLGERIEPDQFRKDQWYRALRALNIRPRDFYSCKDTAISLDITAGENAKKVAQEAGISLSTLDRNYGINWDKAVQQKVQQEVQRVRAKKRKIMILRTCLGVPDGI